MTKNSLTAQLLAQLAASIAAQNDVKPYARDDHPHYHWVIVAGQKLGHRIALRDAADAIAGEMKNAAEVEPLDGVVFHVEYESQYDDEGGAFMRCRVTSPTIDLDDEFAIEESLSQFIDSDTRFTVPATAVAQWAKDGDVKAFWAAVTLDERSRACVDEILSDMPPVPTGDEDDEASDADAAKAETPAARSLADFATDEQDIAVILACIKTLPENGFVNVSFYGGGDQGHAGDLSVSDGAPELTKAEAEAIIRAAESILEEVDDCFGDGPDCEADVTFTATGVTVETRVAEMQDYYDRAFVWSDIGPAVKTA
jgi:hypothetical protein